MKYILIIRVNHLSRDLDQKGDWETVEAPQTSPSTAMDSNPHLGGSQDAPGSNGICNSSSAVMGDLLKEIQIMSPEAADALKQAGFETDSDIQSLTRQDLYELLPGRQDLRLRKDLFEMIHKSRPPNMLQKKLGEQQNNLAICAVMGDLLKEIQIISQKAAVVLKQAGLEADGDIQSLTREDLNELLPGAGDFKLRKNVFEMIRKSRPPNMLQKELGELPNNLAICAVMGDLLKEIQIMSPEAADVLKQAGLEADSDIQLLTREDLNELLPGAGDFKLRKNVFEMIQKSSKLKSLQILPNDNVDPLTNNNTRQLDSKAEKVTVKYKMVVAGQTFGAHTQLMEQVNRATKGDVRLLENSQDSQIIIIFCPITSRIESDVKAAMNGVPGDKHIILVKMHHVCESKSSLCFNTSIDDRNDVLQVNVFYHESLRGLLQCELNDTAVYEIRHELLKHSDHRSKVTSRSTSGQVPENQAKKAPKNNFLCKVNNPFTKKQQGEYITPFMEVKK